MEENNVFMEPVLNSGNQKWLMITKQKIIPSDDPRSIKERIQNPIDPETKIEIERMEPNMWECKKCGAQFQHEGQPNTCLSCNRSGPFEQLTKNINPDKWKLPYWEDIPQENIDMILVYDEIKKLIKNCIVFPEEIQYDLFTLWIIASYKKECFNTAPFLIFRGLISSGKTRALDLLRELGYRMVHSTGVTFPAMCRLTHFHGAGVLVDEIDNKINRKYEAGVKFLDFLKPSYRRGSTYTVADKDDQEETYTYKNFGFKAFAGETGGYDQAVFSRSIDFKMEEDYPSIPELNYVQEDLNHYQTILLNYRYKFNDPDPLPIDFPLKGRHREMFAPLIRTAHHIGIDHEHIIKYVKERKQEQIDELQDTHEYSLLKGIYELQHGLTNDGHMNLESMDAREYVSYKDLTEQIGWEGSNQKLGYLIKKKLQLKTKRIGKVGTCLILNDRKNEEKLKKYYRRYHVN
ncbi:MAG TPA: hypothetical protein VKP59_01420 [Candidatus Thermoplasmatota archaeon]|nr:hypothetical protein [Candidatus Thermoplasmatota archaeon]